MIFVTHIHFSLALIYTKLHDISLFFSSQQLPIVPFFVVKLINLFFSILIIIGAWMDPVIIIYVLLTSNHSCLLKNHLLLHLHSLTIHTIATIFLVSSSFITFFLSLQPTTKKKKTLPHLPFILFYPDSLDLLVVSFQIHTEYTHNSVIICDCNADYIVTLYGLRRLSGRPPDYT